MRKHQNEIEPHINSLPDDQIEAICDVTHLWCHGHMLRISSKMGPFPDARLQTLRVDGQNPANNTWDV